MSVSNRNTLEQRQQATATVMRPVPRDQAQLCLGAMCLLKQLADDPLHLSLQVPTPVCAQSVV